jgi:aminoglycoside phosphotransferase (APT) family kinase protein
LAAEFAARLEAKVRAAVTERILREARAEDQIAAALAAIDRPDAADLKNGIEDLFADEPEAEWRDHIEVKANELSRTEPDSDE